MYERDGLNNFNIALFPFEPFLSLPFSGQSPSKEYMASCREINRIELGGRTNLRREVDFRDPFLRSPRERVSFFVSGLSQ